MKRHILIVEDHAAFREALITVLNKESDLKVIGQADSLAERRPRLHPQAEDRRGGIGYLLARRQRSEASPRAAPS